MKPETRDTELETATARPEILCLSDCTGRADAELEEEKMTMANVVIMDHPLIQHKIGLIRRRETGTKDFRQTISEIAMLICYEATRDLKLGDVEIETPICKTTVKELRGKKMAIVPILRAGLGMVDGMLNLIPAAKVGHIGLYRDPAHPDVDLYVGSLDERLNEHGYIVPGLGDAGDRIFGTK